jgi:peptidoglycan hydrolase CwlO-like protein
MKDDSRKGKKIDLRLTDREFSEINSLCKEAGITRSAYIIQAVTNRKVLTNIDAQVLFQLRKIGNNINQMTKQIHIISKFVDKKEHCLPDILNELTIMNEQIKVINDDILNTDHVSKN